MKTQNHGEQGMTLFEVLVVVAVVLVLAAILLPVALHPPRSHYRVPRISCVNNLKQVGLAFKIWAGDNNDKYPMEISGTNGGTMEFVSSGTVWQHFAVMSNELTTPKILVCPADIERSRNPATSFEFVPAGMPSIQFIANSNTSYFIGVDATDTSPEMFLSGDRNISLSNVVLKAGLHSIRTNAPTDWSETIHVRQGNVLLSDGSVQQLSTHGLQEAFVNTRCETNRLAFP